MFDLLRMGRGKRTTPREVARDRLSAAIKQDRLAVSSPKLSALRINMLTTINEHLSVDGDFTEFTLHQDGEGVYLVSRVRLQ